MGWGNRRSPGSSTNVTFLSSGAVGVTRARRPRLLIAAGVHHREETPSGENPASAGFFTSSNTTFQTPERTRLLHWQVIGRAVGHVQARHWLQVVRSTTRRPRTSEGSGLRPGGCWDVAWITASSPGERRRRIAGMWPPLTSSSAIGTISAVDLLVPLAPPSSHLPVSFGFPTSADTEGPRHPGQPRSSDPQLRGCQSPRNAIWTLSAWAPQQRRRTRRHPSAVGAAKPSASGIEGRREPPGRFPSSRHKILRKLHLRNRRTDPVDVVSFPRAFQETPFA